MSWPIDVYAVYSYRWSEPRPADVLWVSSDADLALLRVEGTKGNPFVNFQIRIQRQEKMSLP